MTRSKHDRGSPISNLAPLSTLQLLDPIHSAALRLVTGAFQAAFHTSPVNSLNSLSVEMTEPRSPPLLPPKQIFTYFTWQQVFSPVLQPNSPNTQFSIACSTRKKFPNIIPKKTKTGTFDFTLKKSWITIPNILHLVLFSHPPLLGLNQLSVMILPQSQNLISQASFFQNCTPF